MCGKRRRTFNIQRSLRVRNPLVTLKNKEIKNPAQMIFCRFIRCGGALPRKSQQGVKWSIGCSSALETDCECKMRGSYV